MHALVEAAGFSSSCSTLWRWRYFHAVCRYSKLRRIKNILPGLGLFIFTARIYIASMLEYRRAEETWYRFVGKEKRKGRIGQGHQTGRVASPISVALVGSERDLVRFVASLRDFVVQICGTFDVCRKQTSSKAPYLFGKHSIDNMKEKHFLSQLASDISISRSKFVWTRVEFSSFRRANYKI